MKENNLTSITIIIVALIIMFTIIYKPSIKETLPYTTPTYIQTQQTTTILPTCKEFVIGIETYLGNMTREECLIARQNAIKIAEQKLKIKITKTIPTIKNNLIQITEFYNGQEGYSLSISKANNSTCIWTWVAGNGSIPDSQITHINRNAIEKHFVLFGNYRDEQWDYKVSCVDDFGNIYTGIFPINK